MARSPTARDQTHELPEYTNTRSKLSLLTPHKLSSVDYGRANHSVPDLTARHRDRVFSEAYNKHSRTVPDFTRIDIGVPDASRPGDYATITGDGDVDPTRITKFSINPYDDSETNTLFKPGAPWIHLPKLDDYIKSLPTSEFSDPKDVMNNDEYRRHILRKKPRCGDMFPPMNQIPDGVTVEDLKSNVTKSSQVNRQGMGNDMVGTAIDGILAAEGSVYGIQYTKLEIIRDFFQFLALALTATTTGVLGDWLHTILVTIPNLLSFNLERVFGNGSAFLLLLCVLCLGALYWFRRMTRKDPNADVEGLEERPWSLRPAASRRANIAIVFLLTTCYLPISKLSLDAIVWADTFWPIANPYLGHNDTPSFQPLGPSSDYRDPDAFCYVTSMRKQDLNFAPVIIGVAVLTLAAVTVWFPIALRKLTEKNMPRVDNFNELGETRNDPDDEYKKVLSRDVCPYNFLYHGYKRKWGTYKTYIIANKFLLVLIVVSISKDNCIFRSFERTKIELVRQSLQIALMSVLLLTHWRDQPFLYETQNISEYWSRSGYLITSALAMLVVLNVGLAAAAGTVIMIVDAVVLTAVFWYVLRETDRFRSIVKKMKRRLDFSLRIYSPKLDFNKHIKRRIWQETWTTLFLVDTNFKMPEDKTVAFSQSPHRPPYLLNFGGTVAERHVENLKIIRQIGIRRYTRAVAPLPDSLAALRARIVEEYVGPDMYYVPEIMMPNVKTYFGKAYVVPFPFSVVMVYDDDGSVVALSQEWEIERFVRQNGEKEVLRRRRVRHMLRALEGVHVLGPCPTKRDSDKKGIGLGLEFDFEKVPVDDTSIHRGVLSIQRAQQSLWKDYNMNSGFQVTITYKDADGLSQSSHERTVGHDVLGITADFKLTPQLEKLFTDNYPTLEKGMREIQDLMKSYREYYRSEAQLKEETLSYGFFINVYDNPSVPLESIPALLVATENNQVVQEIPESHFPTLVYLYERMRRVNISRVHQWWYLFWDDLWRKNSKEMVQLGRRPQDFSPAYRTSICYRPMARQQLEEFLERRGCWQHGGDRGFLHSGVLNRLYLYLNQVAFRSRARRGGSSASGDVSTINGTVKIAEVTPKNGSMVLGRMRQTWRDRALLVKDMMLGRKLARRSRPFFVLHEDTQPINDDDDEEELSDEGMHSGSDEEKWW